MTIPRRGAQLVLIGARGIHSARNVLRPGEGFMRRLILLALTLAAAVVLVPTVAVADSATHAYLLVMDEPNIGVAANGDQIAVTGDGEFSVNPNGVDATGGFTHTDG